VCKASTKNVGGHKIKGDWEVETAVQSPAQKVPHNLGPYFGDMINVKVIPETT
jgi:hypothetical protein